MSNLKKFLIYYFLFLLSGGLFYILIVPPFENFDERAHFSAIKQIVYEKNIVKNIDSYIDKSIQDYQGPNPYTSGVPPFDSNLVYYKFFQDKKKVSEIVNQLNSVPDKKFTRDTIANYEYIQHPPLYYIIMSPVLKFFQNSTMIFQIFILRLLSYFMALLGIGFGIFGVLNLCKYDSWLNKRRLFLGIFLWPLLFPMFFLEFARIGNDSLCLFLIGVYLFLLSKFILNKEILKYILSIGLILSFGLLTKAFFLPITFISYIFIIYLLNKKKINHIYVFINAIFLALIILLIGGVFYFSSYIETGSLTGTEIGTKLSKNNLEFLSIFYQKEFFYNFIRGIATIPVTFIWAGTQSLAHLSFIFYLFPLYFILLTIYRIFFEFLNSKKSFYLFFSVSNFILFLLCLMWAAFGNLLVGVGNANIPGWYVHIFIFFLAPIIGLTLETLHIKKITYIVLYCLSFILLANWHLISLYSGCAIKNFDKNFAFENKFFCFDRIIQIFERLSYVSFPLLAVISFVFFLICTFYLLQIIRNKKFCLEK